VKQVELGRSGLVVGAIGYGAWGLSGDYGPARDDESVATIRRALELGVTLIDTADQYGHGHNERLVGSIVREQRDRVVLATKFGLVNGAVCGRPDYARTAMAASLERLGVDDVDLYYLHRADPDVPIEETVGAMAGLVHEGKARFIGLSEVTAEQVQRAHAVHPIAAVQSEYSLWTREPEPELLPLLRELGIGFVAFAPLGRGFLTGTLRRDQIGQGDFRARLPRFQAENFDRNLQLVQRLKTIAGRRQATPAQIALAWLLDQNVVPIPGTRTAQHLQENLAAVDVRLGPADREELAAAFRPDKVAGARYPDDRRF
jgi:aryl-alcohol dehydrogenase-like predicted oxidoreductase